MIDKFFIQTNDTIWSFLSEIGKSKEVYSCYSFREIDDYTVFFYATSTEVVLVYLDIVDEDSVGKPRPIPIKKLYNHAREMRKFFSISCQFKIVPAIHLMYLTNSCTANYQEVAIKWQKKHWKQNEFGFSVLQNLSGLRPGIIYDSRCEGNPFIPVNEDLSIEGAEYWTKWQTYLRNRGHFDWDDYRYDDWPLPTDKRYSWHGEMGHLISEEFQK